MMRLNYLVILHLDKGLCLGGIKLSRPDIATYFIY